MGDALLRFIVIGDIPGTHTQLGYKGSIAFAGVLIAIILLYVVLSQRRRVAKLLQMYQLSTAVELITL
jgi:hypothetical protein